MADDEKSTSSKEDEPVKRTSTRRSNADYEEAELDHDDMGKKLRLDIPEELKYVLVSDWDLVTNKKQLFSLPAKTPVSVITADYLKYVEKENSSRSDLTYEAMEGVKDFFDAVCENQLLYKLEKSQFMAEMEDESKTPSEVYGGAHLLRLMVNINDLFNSFNVDEFGTIDNILTDFLDFLEENRGKYFTSKNYVKATDDYLKGVETN